ncbi:hypothetical protein [Spiroplasma endosymbiont of Polydrusus pterygomalis]|uniref:hypothetical protein n=1 Tax=Spiroplasma endosymbiont of Polydrusus pterygomalis TaxID=3139327 RepID=UPI003CCAC65A
MSLFKKNNYLLGTSSIFLFILLLLTLNIFKIPRVYSVNGQTIFISDTRYENKGYFVYALDLKREEFLKFNSYNQITIFFTIDKCYLTIFFPKWNNNQLLIDQNINANTYLNQIVVIIIGKESLLTFIWNNITT